MTVSQSRFRAPAQEGRRITIRASKVKLRFESRYSSFQLRASSLQNLIANLELEFRLTHTKLSPLRISNRKYFAVFYADLLHRREKSGRPTTSDGAVVATELLDYELRIASCDALGAAAGGDQVEEALHTGALAPRQGEEFAGVEIGGFVAEEGFHAPLNVGGGPGAEAVTFGDDPVVAKCVQHVACNSNVQTSGRITGDAIEVEAIKLRVMRGR